MATLKLGTTTVMTESSGVISDIPAAGVTGTLPNAVQDNVTRLGTVTTGSISSGVTGFSGIKVCDQWRLHTSHSSSVGTYIFDENLERTDTYEQGDGTNAIIGGSIKMDWNSSTGYFTFPLTGIWWIAAKIRCYAVSDDVDYMNLMMDFDYGTGDTHIITGIESMHKLDSYCMPSLDTMIDISNTSTQKVRFKWNSQANVLVQGSSTVNHTSFTFTRLGDR